MSKTVQWKRGNANVSTAYIGAQGEITVDTSEWALRLHDGLTPGGFKISNDTDGNVDLGNIRITDQTIQGKNSNQDVNINASGDANIVLFSDSTVISNDIYVQGNAKLDGIIIQSNTVSTENPFSNLILSSSTGNVITPTRFFANSIRLTNENFYIEQVFSNALNRNVVSFYSAINNAQDITIRANNNFLGYHANPLGTIGIRTFASNTVPVTILGNTSITGNLTSDSYITSNEYSSYSFAGNSGIRNRSFDANVNAFTILHNNFEVARFLSNSLTQLTGNVIITGGPGVQNSAVFPEGRLQVYSNVNTYSQIVHQNLSQGNISSTDYVATANNGDDTTFYVDLGIAGNLHIDPDFFGDTTSNNDAYLYVTGYDQAGPSTGNVGNLIIGSTNGIVKTFIGNTAEANVVTVVTSTGLLPGANVVYSLGSATRQWKDLWVSNNTIYLGGVSLSVSADGNLLVNGNTVSGGGNANVSLGNFVFSANSLLNFNGGNYTNGDLSHGHTAAVILPLNGSNNPIQILNTYSNVTISSGSNSSITGTWTFDNSGRLLLPTSGKIVGVTANNNGYLTWEGSSSGDGLGFTTMTLVPDDTVSSQVLVLDPTAPGHIHLRVPGIGGNIEQPAANIFLGSETTSFEITAQYGVAPEARIHSGNNTWTFGNGGNLLLPRDAVGNTDPYLWINGGPAPTISSIDVSLAGPANLQIVSDYLNLSGYTGAKVAIKADNGEIATDANMVLTTNNANVGNTYSWTFGNDGSLSTPGNVTVNDTLFIVGSIQPIGASPAPSLSGFSSISTVISGNPNEGNITAHNYLIANGGIITSGNITANYLIGNGSELTSVNAATVDILNTNGLGTTFYPTFVENRTGGQILRADVDLSYRTDTNTLTVNSISSSGNITGNTAGFAIGYRDIPQVVFTSNATLALTDAGKHYFSSNSANVITIPNNTTVSFNIGTAISIIQQGTANLTVAPGSGVTMYLAGNSTSSSRTVGNYGMATLMKVDTNTWFINGTGVS